MNLCGYLEGCFDTPLWWVVPGNLKALDLGMICD